MGIASGFQVETLLEALSSGPNYPECLQNSIAFRQCAYRAYWGPFIL